MGSFGGYYKGEKRKLKKRTLEKKAEKQFSPGTWQLPRVEIIKKKGKKSW